MCCQQTLLRHLSFAATMAAKLFIFRQHVFFKRKQFSAANNLKEGLGFFTI
jgi:hypothetical protein